MQDLTLIREYRRKLGWKQSQLADFLGVDPSTVSRIENGQSPRRSVRKMLDRWYQDEVRPAVGRGGTGTAG